MEQGRNKVFINPNFNKRPSNSVPVGNVPVMHVNPNFYQHLQNVHPLPKPKIYINPNFVRPNGTNNHQIQHVNTPHSYVKPSPLMDSSNTLIATGAAPVRHTSQSSVQNNIANPNFGRPNRVDQPVLSANNNNSHYITNSYIKPSPLVDSSYTLTASSIQTSLVPQQPYKTNSRYSFVRLRKPEEPLNNIIKPQTSTIKISKYKSIKLTDVKKNLDSVKPDVKITPFKVSNNHKCLIRTINNHKVISKTPAKNANRYKLVRSTLGIGKPQFKRQTSSTAKKIISSRTRIKAAGEYKKNNIPCPQFRKYGKCLRKSYGKCEFLHDKKHVSICRKFLNGVCHNNDCLLSHELSDKKMPTCYFYLKGMCTKDGCPYLHVKLNEKAKICLDFMRGYCEKGDKCLNRHVAKSLNIDKNRKLILKKLTQQKLIKYKLEKSKVKSNTSSTQKRKSKVHLNQQSSQENNDHANRYYKESVTEPNSSENLEIKPTRCKLGTLPSFIQL
ncbi:zinc finger CCCH domain-containing protein 3 [Cydia strobilella]|uniref:zinc finger CCCH domain-containing protein 3 n=1 Tax=Cydia strobilella TaxID=1100964 RepID=UPI003005E72D